MKENKKQVVIATSILIVVTVLLLGLTYAYYKTRINENIKDKSISVVSKKLEITYGDGNGVIEPTEEIEPGYTAEKTFSVENTGENPISYSIKLDNITNTFTRIEDWTYVLKKGETEVSSGTIVSGSYQILVSSTSIDSKTTDNYTLTIKYANLTDVDQSVDMGATLSLRVNIDEAKVTWNSAPEGTLLYAIKNDNTVTEPLTKPGIEPSARSFSVEYGTEKSYDISTDEKSTIYYTFADSYEIDSKTGKTTLINPSIGKYSDIYSNLEGKYVTSCVGSSSDTLPSTTGLNNLYKITSANTNETATLKCEIVKIVPTGTEAVLASTEDDYGTSYYFRGNVKNNYVNFSGMCWRVVRVQGDGSIKITLADRDHECDDPDYFNTTNRAAFLSQSRVAYKLEGDSSYKDLDYLTSDLKEMLKSWLYGGNYDFSGVSGTFDKQIDDSKLENAEWCNDMAYNKVYYDDNYDLVTDPDKAVHIDFNSTAYDRLSGEGYEITPSLKCNFLGQENTKSQKVVSKIGLITADEVVFAGGTMEGYEKLDYYLMNNAYDSWFTMTPSFLSQDFSYMISIDKDGAISSVRSKQKKSVRPALVLKSTIEVISGNGTQENPYKIQ